jgi:hypothetical protein
VSYEIWLSRDDGTRLALLDSLIGFEYAISLHQIGACVLRLPGTFNKALLAPDRRIEIWRAPAGGSLALERVYLVRRIVDDTDAAGVRTLTVTGVDGNDLLRRRIVAYAAGAAQADMTDESDDMVRAIAIDNLGSDALTARQISSTYLTFAPERSAGVSLTKAFARRNVLTVLQEIADIAETAGTPIYWHGGDAMANQWGLGTYTGQPGPGHTYPAGPNPVLLGLEYGNLAEPTLEMDYTAEVNYVYAGGQGEGAARVIQTAEDTARSGRSLFGRCEAFADARNESTTAGVLAAAQQALQDGRPRLRFTAKIVESVGTCYGIHWRWGDRVTAQYAGESYDAMIRAVAVTVSATGAEMIDARLEVLA